MSLINSVLTWMFKKRLDQIQYFMDHPVKAQKRVFNKLIDTAKSTEWGLKYGYASMTNPEEFRHNIPIQNYETLKPYIERIIQGEQGILWPSEIKWFAKSSGTTSEKSKFIPVSKETLDECHFNGGRDVLALYAKNNPATRIFTGKGLVMGGSTQINKMNEGSYFGDLSAVMMKNMPLLGQLIRTPDLSIALMDEWEAKLEKIANETIKKNVTNMAGVPTWTLVLIEKILQKTGKDNLADVWPNLELYIHGGVSFKPYKQRFEELIKSKNMHYMETYNASEGFFGIQHDLNHPSMLLMLDYGIFYEFIPASQANANDPDVYLIGDVEMGKNYAVIISTNSGLWRYMIGDTISFTNLNPYTFIITGRVKHYINAFGEEVIVDNTDEAIARACLDEPASVRDYTVAPVYFSAGGNGAHEWIIEFSNKPENLSRFESILDQELKNLNSDYEAKRYKDIALRKPIIHIAQSGFFDTWLKSKGKLGGQHKVPRLSNDRSYMESMLKLLSE